MATAYYTAPNFHVVFRDATGAPAINGTAEFFKSSDHGTHKAVFEDRAGTNPLPNPVTLNSQGVIADASGAAKPVFYANDEDYYVVVKDSAGGNIQTQDDWNSNMAFFPFPAIEDSNLTNYILNPQFRFFEKQNLTDSDLYAASVIADEGWYFYKASSLSTNQIDYTEFTLGQTDVPYNPKYYLKFSCTAAGAETEKRILLRFKDVMSFSGETMSFGVWARSETGVPSTLRLMVTQRYKTTPTVDLDTTIIDTYTVPTTWTKLTTENFTIPSIAGKSINEGEDEFEIALGLPLNQIAIIGLTNVQMNIGEILFDFNYVSSEEERLRKKAYELEPISAAEDTVTTNYGYPLVSDGSNYVFRDETGKIETYLLGAVPAFCLPMDGATYERQGIIPNTNNRVSYDRLYQKWRNDPNIGDGNAFGYGSDGFSPLVYSSATTILTNTNSGTVTAWADNDTGFAISEAHSSNPKGFDVQFNTRYNLDQEGVRRSSEVLWIINTANGNVTDINAGTSGFTTIGVLEQGTAGTPEQSYLEATAATGLAGTYFTIDTPTMAYYVWFTVDEVGTDPAVGGRAPLIVPLSGSDTSTRVMARIKDVLNGHRMTKIVANAASTLSGGEYFLAETVSTQFYIWFRKDGVGVDPAPGGRTGIVIDIEAAWVGQQVAFKIQEQVSAFYFQIPDIRGYFLRAWDDGAGIDKDASTRYGLDPNNIIYGDRVGTGERDVIIEHRHHVRSNDTSAFQHNTEDHYMGGAGPTDPPPYSTTADVYMAGDMITLTGYDETRPINFSVLYAIRY